jgi:AraC-type DNA-binding domain-containing proteins
MEFDVLSDVLLGLRARGSVYFCDALAHPWSKLFEGQEHASFHQVRQGACRVISAESEILLGPGDLVFLGPGETHTLESYQPEESRSLDQSETLLMCGYCEVTEHAYGSLSTLFPRMSIIRNDQLQQRSWLNSVLDQLSFEYRSTTPGSQLIVNKLTEVMVVELLRINFGMVEERNLLTALKDKKIATALESLHAEPEKNWTLQTLGEHIGMSRSAIAKRFTELVGVPMFEYLTNLRMQRAIDLLQTSDLRPADIAEKIGYESVVAFTKAFKRHTGETPSKYRRSLFA